MGYLSGTPFIPEADTTIRTGECGKMTGRGRSDRRRWEIVSAGANSISARVWEGGH